MSKKQTSRRHRKPDDTPSTAKQLTAAMAALGKYAGDNSDAEHAAEAARLGGMNAYQMSLANALLGIAEIDAMLADGSGVTVEQMHMAHQQALISAGVEDDPGKLLHFLQWRALRVAGPLRVIAQNREVGPLPLAAAHAAEGLQWILGVCAEGQNQGYVSPETPEKMKADLKAAREALTDARGNLDSMLTMLKQAEDLFKEARLENG